MITQYYYSTYNTTSGTYILNSTNVTSWSSTNVTSGSITYTLNEWHHYKVSVKKPTLDGDRL